MRKKQEGFSVENNKDRDRFYGIMSDEQIALFDSIHKNIFTFCEATAGSGKAQPLYSKVLTPNGYITMGEVRVGTEVIGEDGKPHKVLGVFPQGKKPVYELTFSDGTKCRCSDEHLWTVKIKDRKKWETVALRDIIDANDLTRKFKSRGKFYNKHNYKIPIASPIQFNSHYDVPIDPWLLGVLIGDGGLTNNTIRFSNSEIDIVSRVELIVNNYNCKMKHIVNYDYNIVGNGVRKNELLANLRLMGLINKRAENKFIPDIYKYGSIDIRLGLLQGLIDTDGYVNNSQINYYTSSKTLADDVMFLVQSLGGTCSCNKHKAFYTYKGEKKQGLDNYELYIKLPSNLIPFTSKKHSVKFNINRNTDVYRYIHNIEFIGEEECQCIYIDSVNHLYITDNMIVTHNTIVAVAAMLSLLERGEINKIVYIQKPSERYLSQGYLPGTMEEKSQFLFLPFYDAMHDLGFFDSAIEQGIIDGTLNLITDCALRGVNLEKAGIIIDEAENMNLHTLKLIFTRCHDNCHIALLGDRYQKDNRGDNSKFVKYGEYLAEKSFGSKVELTKNFRGKFSKAAEAFEI